MGIITKEVEVKPSGKMIQYYRDKGYDAKYHEPLIVKVEDLPPRSDKTIQVLCDYCKKEVFTIKYHAYNQAKTYVNKHACKNCWQKKTEEVLMVRYGVTNVSQLKGVQEKRKNTMESRYGVSVPLQSEKIKNKQIETMFNVYGVKNISQLDSIKELKSQTLLEHYGVKNPSQSDAIKNKMCATNMYKYGCVNPMQSPDIRKKANKTLCENGNQKTSMQQLFLHSLYGGKLNHPISYYAVDICLTEEKLVIEYDGGGHDLRVKLGRLTQEEFNQKEIIRNNIIKREGYKTIRLISSKDLLPSDEILLQLLSHSKEYFSTTNHTWIEYDFDSSTVRNAEQKEGIFFNYGQLRKLKSSDLESLSETA